MTISLFFLPQNHHLCKAAYSLFQNLSSSSPSPMTPKRKSFDETKSFPSEKTSPLVDYNESENESSKSNEDSMGS